MDEDSARRHRLAAWVVPGPAQAVLAGDALQVAMVRQVAGLGGGSVRGMAAAPMESRRGQPAGLAFEVRA